jgi:hypothetical protein
MSIWDYYRDCGTDDYGREYELSDINSDELSALGGGNWQREHDEREVRRVAVENSRRINREFRERLPGYRVALAQLALAGRRPPLN